jgi:hypothetical protein
MKKIIIILVLVSSVFGNAQTVVGICTGHPIQDLPMGSYIQDINNDFDKFVGIWVWSNGTDTVTFKLIKVTHQLNSEYHSYRDYMIGDYSYTTNNGNIIIVNTINQTTDLSAIYHPLYANCPDNETKIDFVFKDIVIGKSGCKAIFEFLPGSTTQMLLVQKNKENMGCIDCTLPSMNFTIPNNIVLTKQ